MIPPKPVKPKKFVALKGFGSDRRLASRPVF
jgi:hypothetical protein